MDDIVSDVDGFSEFQKGFFDNFDGTNDSGTESARVCKEESDVLFFHGCGKGREGCGVNDGLRVEYLFMKIKRV
jgi:hypothetical protein